MKRSSTILLQTAIALIGAGALAFMLWEPRLEGRNAHATAFEIYFKDPVLAYAYLASIPFFVALYQAFKALGYAGREKAFSPESVKALRTMKYCALAVIGFIALSAVFIPLDGDDDRPAGVFMRIIAAVPPAVLVAAAARFERALNASPGGSLAHRAES